MPLAPVMAEGLTPVVWGLKRQSNATDQTVRDDLVALPAHIDHIDELIAAGTLGGPELNAADYQIGTSVARAAGVRRRARRNRGPAR